MRYRHVFIYTYSGTGNSRRVAAWLAEAARDAGSAVLLRPMPLAQPDQELVSDADTLLILTLPTHGFAAPWPVLRFAVDLPRRAGHDAVVLATRGGLKIGPVFTPGFEGSATLALALVLALKGYRVRGLAGIDMPSNWTAFHPGLPPEAVEAIIQRARDRTARLSEMLLVDGRGWPSKRLEWLLGVLCLPISFMYITMGRFFLAKLFFASERCTGCGLCAVHCPHQAIEMRGTPEGLRPYWTLRCESCMRCMAYCPEQAVEASHSLGLAAHWAARAIPMVAALNWIAGRAPGLGFLQWVPDWLAIWAAAMGVLFLAYPLFHALLTLKPINWLLTHSTLTRWYRRYREPGTTLEDLSGRSR